MALQSKTITTEHYNTMPYVSLTVYENSTSIPNNVSGMSYDVVLHVPGSYSPTASKTITWTVGSESGSWTGKLTGGSGYTMTIKSGATFNQAHDSDGTKTIALACSFTLNTSWAGQPYNTLYGSGSMTLTPIPRYASCVQSLSSKTETSITMQWSSDSTIDYIWYSKDGGSSWSAIGAVNGTSGTYTFYGLSSGTTYSVKTRVRRKDSQLTTDSATLSVSTYAWPYATSLPSFTIENTLTIGVYNPLGRTFTVTMIGDDGSEQDVGTSYSGTSVSGFRDSSWYPFWYRTIPGKKSGTYKVRITYGSHTETRTGGTYTASSANAPTVSGLTYVDTNSTVTAITGDSSQIVQGKSTVRYTATGIAAKNYASISSVKVAVNGNTYNLTLSGTTATGGNASINSGSDVTATVTVTDSRGFTATASVTVNMVAYTAPTAIITAVRQSNFYNQTVLNVDADYTHVGTNGVTITYSGTDGAGSISGTLQDNTPITLNLDNQSVWTLTVTLTDSFGISSTLIKQVNRGVPLLYKDVLNNSIGLNRIPSGKEVADIHNIAQGTGADNTGTSVSADTITQIPLTDIIIVGEGFELSDGGIKVTYAGTYRVGACAYLTGGASSGITRKDVFIRRGTDFSSATEVASITDNVGTTSVQQHGSVGTTPKLVTASENDIFYIACRLRGGTGSYYAGNSGTYLLVERIA